MTLEETTFAGQLGQVQSYVWTHEAPRYVAVISHGYGEHAGRYGHVAEALVADGAVVHALDHHGHGRSEGERASVLDAQVFTRDLDALIDHVRAAHAGLGVVLIGHSMGGLIATRYAQLNGSKLTALVLSGPVIGKNPAFEMLLGMDPIPDVPIDPAVLSRDPAVGEAYMADELVYHGPFRRETLAALLADVDAVAAGPRIELPTLWIHGELDQLAPLEVTRPAVEAIRTDAWRATVYPGAMHEIFNETNRDEVIADTIAFIGASVAS